MPTPRVPSQSTREKRASDVNHSAMNGCFDERLQVARPIQHDDDVVRAVADHLVGDVGVARPDVLRASERQAAGL